MRTPVGIVLEIGQLWKEVDPRFDRVVKVTAWSQMEEKVQLNSRTWASLRRFNGKRGGYEPYGTGRSLAPSKQGDIPDVAKCKSDS